jgi:hypothetical protein
METDKRRSEIPVSRVAKSVDNGKLYQQGT